MRKRLYRTLIIVTMITILFGISACSNDSSETISTKSESTKESTAKSKKETETESTEKKKEEESTKKQNEEKSAKEKSQKEETQKSESKSKEEPNKTKESEGKKESKADSPTKATDTKETKTNSSNKTAESTHAPASTTAKTNNSNKATAPTQTTTPAPTVAPTPAHTHSYTSSVSQNPTCSSQGVRTYVCSCGSSYTESIPTTEHSWTPRYETVHHEAKGEMRQVQVGTSGEMYECAYCGGMFSSHEEIRTHWKSYIGTDNSHARTNYFTHSGQPIYENQWVETQAAYDEQVVVGYTCTVCGATK